VRSGGVGRGRGHEGGRGGDKGGRGGDEGGRGRAVGLGALWGEERGSTWDIDESSRVG